MVYAEKRLGGIVLPDLAANTPMQLPFRTMEFLGSTSQAIVVYVPSNGCLRVLDPANGDELTYSRYPESLTALIPLSKPSLILTGSQSLVLPAPPFGPEPPRMWCYYYERAELARQAGDWNRVVTLDAEAAQSGCVPEDAFEWLPFIEAEARAGQSGYGRTDHAPGMESGAQTATVDCVCCGPVCKRTARSRLTLRRRGSLRS